MSITMAKANQYKQQDGGAAAAPPSCWCLTLRLVSLQAVGDVVESVGDRGLQELQRHDDQDGDEGQDEGIFHHALALLGALPQLGHQGLRCHDLLGDELAHERYLQELCLVSHARHSSVLSCWR